MGRKSVLPESVVRVVDRGGYDDVLISTLDWQGSVRCFCGNRLCRRVVTIDGATLACVEDTRCLACGARLVDGAYVPAVPLPVSLRAWPEMGRS
jgi:hypothetical protein